MARTFVIGDIHGAYLALLQVIERVAPRPEDRLIFLGDYVDGWSQSKTVIDHLQRLEATRECIFVKGNHDAWCEEWLAGFVPDPSWLMHGGWATIESYSGIEMAERSRHLRFFARMRPYYEEEDRLYIHAGFTSMYGPSQEQHESSFFWDRTLWEVAMAVDERIPRNSVFYPQRLLLYKEIYIGHTPTTNFGVEVPMHRCNVWNMDTGAAFTGKISVMDISTKELIQSDPVQQMYPRELGRNR